MSTGRTITMAAILDHDDFNVPRSDPDGETPAGILRADGNRHRRGRADRFFKLG
jgi:hypothetical protein